ncbi:MAG: hypothetical protein LQ348_005783 [Seirophora lacunosa]|nr:MAG: hypothetical protein LQ348_005783 [Seirophora lacunosa]
MAALDHQLLSRHIPIQDEPLKIADVATGTGIWLLEFARSHPRAAQLDGFDISLDQIPPAEWLPSNVSFHCYNVNEEPPEDFVGKYDVLHVRNLAIAIKNDDPKTVLGHLLAMLKPGGYLQWAECDLAKMEVVKANQDCSSTHVERLLRVINNFDPLTAIWWPERLGKVFKEAGLEGVTFDARWPDDGYISYLTDVNLLGLEEMIDRIGSQRKARPEEVGDLRAVFARAAEEARQGAALRVKYLIAVGRKLALKPDSQNYC